MPEIVNAVVETMSASPATSRDEIVLPEVTAQIEQDGSRLSDLLADQLDQPAMAANPTMMSANPAVDTKNLGDVLLKRLDVIGNNFTKNIEKTHRLLDTLPSDLRVQDVMRLQLEMSAISLEVELVGKGVQKAVQHVEQLTKLQ